MDEICLTNNGEYLLCVLYEAYLQRRKDGDLEVDAKSFGNCEAIQSLYLQDWALDDIDNSARELASLGFLMCYYGDNVIVFINLENRAIAYMEHQFGRKADKLLQRISTLRSIFLG